MFAAVPPVELAVSRYSLINRKKNNIKIKKTRPRPSWRGPRGGGPLRVDCLQQPTQRGTQTQNGSLQCFSSKKRSPMGDANTRSILPAQRAATHKCVFSLHPTHLPLPSSLHLLPAAARGRRGRGHHAQPHRENVEVLRLRTRKGNRRNPPATRSRASAAAAVEYSRRSCGPAGLGAAGRKARGT